MVQESWEEMFMRKQQFQIKAKVCDLWFSFASHAWQEDELRDALVAERDKEIELIISKLEEESHKQHTEIQQNVCGFRLSLMLTT
jgi:hypothetical protein